RRVPPAVFRLPRDLLARFLNRALGVAAAVWRPQAGDTGRVVVPVRSEGLVHDLQHLLLRFGVVATVAPTVVAGDPATPVSHELVVDRPEQRAALAAHIGLLGHEAELGAVVAHARSVQDRDPAPVAATAGGSAGTSCGVAVAPAGPGDIAGDVL